MIILFNGPPASGKDCAADYFKAKGFKHLSFKYQLFKETFKFFDVTEDWFMEDYDNRTVKVSEEIDVNKNYVISDGGFSDELFPIINKIGADNFVLVQLVRDGCDYSTDSRRYFNGKIVGEYVNSHKTDIDNKYILDHKFDVKTHRIHNNGTVQDLNKVLHKIYEEEADVRVKERA
jgi:hypothetical protein